VPLGYETGSVLGSQKYGPGRIGTERRWSKQIVTPGVGDYDITKYKNLNRATETSFENNYSRPRAMSAVPSNKKNDHIRIEQNQSNTIDMERRSRSPNKSVHGNLLGGPIQPVINVMNNQSREQRRTLYFPENESALYNTMNTTGPAQFNLRKSTLTLDQQPRFSIPKVS